MAAVEKVAKYSKMVEAACGALAMYGTTLLDHQAMLPDGSVYWINLAIGAFTVFRVWLVRNEELIEDVVEAAEDLYEGLEDVVETTPRRGTAGYAYGRNLADEPTEVFELPGRHHSE